MPVALLDLTGLAGRLIACPFTLMLTVGEPGRTIFTLSELNPSPTMSQRAPGSEHSVTRKIACFSFRPSTTDATSRVNFVTSCAALAGTLISPIFLPFQVALSQGPSSQMFTLNAFVVLGARNRLNIVLLPALAPAKAFKPFWSLSSPPKPKYLYPMMLPFWTLAKSILLSQMSHESCMLCWLER